MITFTVSPARAGERGRAERGQALEVNSNRLAIRIRQLRQVAHHTRHSSAKNIAIRCKSTGQCLDDIGIRPISETCGGQIGRIAFSVGSVGTGQVQARFHGAEQVAWRVAFAAMARAFDEIAAKVPLRTLFGIRLNASIAEVKQLPQAKQRGELKTER